MILRLFLADEPTGNLDTENSQKITKIMRMLKANGKTAIVASHNPELIQFADRIVCLKDGSLICPID
jgi:putative ABC transport system ATP-binding protein